MLCESSRSVLHISAYTFGETVSMHVLFRHSSMNWRHLCSMTS